MSRSSARRLVAWLVPIAVALCVPSRASAGRWSLVVLPASGRGVSAQIIERARSLFVESLGRPNRYRVTDYDRPPTAERATTAAAVQIARLTSTDLAVAIDISHDGATTTFEVLCWDGLSGATRCHLHETTAAGPELLPDFTEWLAMRLMRAVDAAPGATEPNDGFVTAGPPHHEPRAITFGVSAGVMVPIDSPARNSSPLGGFSVFAAADAGSVLVRVGGDHQSGSDDHRSWGLGLELEAPLADGERMPYLGAGAWFVTQHLGGQGASGLQLRPALGILWGRHDVARLRTEVGYFVDLFQEREPDRLIPGAGQGHISHGLMTSLGASF